MSDDQVVEESGTTRRRFVQAAAAAGVIGATWTAPVIRGSVAGAQTNGGSVNGSCTGAFITWSGGMDNWLGIDNSNASVELALNDMNQTFANAFVTLRWDVGNMVCGTLTAPVTVAATGNAEALTEADGATLEITTGVSCQLGNFVFNPSGMVNPTSGTSVMVWGVPIEMMTSITFDILC